MSATILILYALAVIGLTRIITVDEIMRPSRERVIAKLNPDSRIGPRLAYLIGCPRCASVWVAAAAAPFLHFLPTHPLPYITAWILAVYTVACTLSAYIDREQ